MLAKTIITISTGKKELYKRHYLTYHCDQEELHKLLCASFLNASGARSRARDLWGRSNGFVRRNMYEWCEWFLKRYFRLSASMSHAPPSQSYYISAPSVWLKDYTAWDILDTCLGFKECLRGFNYDRFSAEN